MDGLDMGGLSLYDLVIVVILPTSHRYNYFQTDTKGQRFIQTSLHVGNGCNPCSVSYTESTTRTWTPADSDRGHTYRFDLHNKYIVVVR